MRKERRVSLDKAEVDLTPMLDVVFIMLIFFIVAASFITEKSISLNNPEESDSKNTVNKSLVIRIDSKNNLFIDRRRIDVNAVEALVRQYKAEQPEGQVIVKAHEYSSTERYMQVADQVVEAQRTPPVLSAYQERVF